MNKKPKKVKNVIKKIRKAAKEDKIKFAPAHQLAFLEPHVDKIMKAIEVVCGIKGAWISDESVFDHFDITPLRLTQISKIIGVKIKASDMISKTAARMRDQTP